MKTPFVWIVLAVNLTLMVTCHADDVAIAVFDKSDYGDWKQKGDAFRAGPLSGARLDQFGITNAQEKAVCSSKVDGEAAKGTLTSPPFKIERPYIAFCISGGNYEHSTCLNLLVEGKVVRSAVGWNSDKLLPASWGVSEFAGQNARIQVMDEADGDWGHINVSSIIQTDKPERMPVDVGPLYREAARPQFHFTARQWTMDRLNPGPREEGWLNDLNGLVYYDGEYHLFAQRWNKCWIHAVSRDLVHWTELEPAFWEESLDSGVQSGSCVIDYNNTSGLSPDKATPPMVAFWSRNDNRSQCISYSLDHGRTWKHYEKNPIMVHPNRDPKVFWYEPGNEWVMMLYGDRQYNVLTSKNLLDWTDQHKPINNSYECPDIFELPVDGDRSNMKWVLVRGDGKYSVGTFNGTELQEETGRFPCNIGPNFYATQTWGNTETGDGRRIQAAWLQGNFSDMPFNQQVTFPCELTLRSTPNGVRLFREPIRELATLHKSQDTWSNQVVNSGETLPLEPSGDMFHIQAEVAIPPGAKLTFNLRGATVVLTSTTIQSATTPKAVTEQVKYIEFLVDRGSVEAFVNHGEVSGSRFFVPTQNGLSVKAEGGNVVIHSLLIHPLNSIWQGNNTQAAATASLNPAVTMNNIPRSFRPRQHEGSDVVQESH